MSLSEHYVEGPPSGCRTCWWYDQLDDADRRFFDEKATGPVAALWRACRDHGLTAAESRFREHMRNHYHGSR